MTCDQTQALLDAFADGELGWGTAWRVRRHLAGCALCAAELAEVQHLGSRVRAWRGVPAPAHLHGRITATLPHVVPSVIRRPFPIRRAAVGLAGLTVASVAFLWLIPGQPGNPTIALADVEQAMQQVQTISWRTGMQTNGPLDHKPKNNEITLFDKMTCSNWLRRSPPALASGDFNVIPSPGFILIKNLFDARGAYSLYKDHCGVAPASKGAIQRRVESQIHGFTEFPQAESSYSRGSAQITRTNLHQGYVLVDGERQARFDRDVKIVWKMGGKHTTYQLAHVSTWADPKTHRIARIEEHVSQDTHMGKGFRQFLVIMDHFQYDQTPPKGVFDWSPPAGVRVVRRQSEPVKK